MASALDWCFRTIAKNSAILALPWTNLKQNLSGKYNAVTMSGPPEAFDKYRKSADEVIQDGVYIFADAPRRVRLIKAKPDLGDIYFANGSFRGEKYELLSYKTDDKLEADGTAFLKPTGTLPESDTHGQAELVVQGRVLTNVPNPLPDYVTRGELEDSLLSLLEDDRYRIVTLHGRGGLRLGTGNISEKRLTVQARSYGCSRVSEEPVCGLRLVTGLRLGTGNISEEADCSCELFY